MYIMRFPSADYFKKTLIDAKQIYFAAATLQVYDAHFYCDRMD